MTSSLFAVVKLGNNTEKRRSFLAAKKCNERSWHIRPDFLRKRRLWPHFYSARNARIASAVLATAIPSVRLSVCPSHAGIVSKRRHVARCSLHHWIAKCV